MAVLAFYAAGSAIGAGIGDTFLGVTAAAWGGAIGSLVGNSLMAKNINLPTQYGPRLGDLKIQQSVYGNMVPRAFGRVRLAGNVIWDTGIVEHTTTQSVDAGGKGGGGATQTQVSYYYTISCAIALCEGPIIGVRRIWANGKLVYSVADDATVGTVIASSDNNITVYTGSETQDPDPLIESVKGAGNVPGYRGTAYIVLQDFLLSEFGNRLPNFEFEVVTDGTVSPLTPQIVYTIPSGEFASQQLCILSPNGNLWLTDAGGGFPGPVVYVYNLYSESLVQTFNFGTGTNRRAVAGNSSDGAAMWLYHLNNLNNVTHLVLATAAGQTQECLLNSGSPQNIVNGGLFHDLTNSHFKLYCMSASTSPSRIDDIDLDGGTATVTSLGLTGTFSYLWNANQIPGRIYAKRTVSVSQFEIGYIQTLDDTWVPLITFSENCGQPAMGPDGYIYTEYGSSGNHNVLRKYDAAGNFVDDVTLTGFSGTQANLVQSIAISPTGVAWVAVNQSSPSTLRRFFKIDTGTMAVDNYTAMDTATQTQQFLNSYTFNAAPLYIGLISSQQKNIQIFEPLDRIAVTAVDLALDIVKPLCLLSGLDASDLDISGITGVDVEGYVISQRGPVRGMIEPLMTAYFFDAVESDNQIKFVARGGSSVVTLADDDLSGNDSDPQNTPDPITLTRAQEVELPLEVNLLYLNRENDYQVSQQSSRRLITSAKEVSTIQLPLVLTDDQAKRIADAIMYVGWVGRDLLEFSTSRKYDKYEPTDVATVGDQALIVRLLRKDQGVNGLMRWQAVVDDAAIYSQSADGAGSTTPSGVVGLLGPTEAIFMDIPLLRDVDDDPGFYFAAAGVTSVWRGTQLYQSKDSGDSYSPLTNGLIIDASVIGAATTVLGDCTRPGRFDEGNTVEIVLSSGTLSNATRASVLNGANVAMLGDEIIQFRNAELVDTDTYLLSGLLRGRTGSEAFCGSHVAGERFVLLDTLVRTIYQSWGDLGNSYLYKPVSVNATLAKTPGVPFANEGRRVKPLSPVHVGGGRNDSGDLLVHWKRRTRLQAVWRDNVDAPLGEASERYEVDILDGADVVRTLTATTPAATYTVAQQTTDFGGAEPSIDIEIYQISEKFGRGYPAAATI